MLQARTVAFDWTTSPAEARGVWEGFLWSPRLHEPLLRLLKKQFLGTVKHYEKLGERAERFAAFLTYAALDTREVYTMAELRGMWSSLPQAGLEESSQALVEASESADPQREEYWANRVEPFLHYVWPKSRKIASERISESFARLSIAARGKFPDALDTVAAWLVRIEHSDYIVHLLHEEELDGGFPQDALRLCLAPDKKHFDEDMQYCNGASCCTAGYGGFSEAKKPRRVFIGVVEYSQRLKLVASLGGPLNVRTTWQQSNIDPKGDVNDDGAYPGSYKGFDFAPYKVSKDQVAFGIRVAWQTMYGGGGGTFTALMLFLVQGERIVNVLSEPIEEWGMSGSRPEEKSEWETKNVLRILPHKHSGYFDLQLKERGGKWKKTFQWDAEANRYLPLPW